MHPITTEKNNLRGTRYLLQMTKKELASELNTSPANIKNWETGRATPPGFLGMALAIVTQKYSWRKTEINEDPRCPHCNEPYKLLPVGKVKYMVNHKCPDGFIHKTPIRSKHELLRTLTLSVGGQLAQNTEES